MSPERLERVLSVGTRLRGRHYGQRPSCAAPTGRTHGRTDQQRRASKKTLANGEPSTHGEKREAVPARWNDAIGLALPFRCAAANQESWPIRDGRKTEAAAISPGAIVRRLALAPSGSLAT